MDSLKIANEHIAQKKLASKIQVLSNGTIYFLIYISIFGNDVDFLAELPVKNTSLIELKKWIDNHLKPTINH